MDVFTDFDAADAARGDKMLCGTLLPSGEPRYFLLDAGADDEAVREAAFSVRHGRPIEDYERWLVRTAEAMRRANADLA